MRERLVDLLQSYDPGDLVAMADIIEAAEGLAGVDEDEFVQETCREISAAFRGAARGGEIHGLADSLQRWVEVLQGSSEAPGTNDGGKGANGSEALAFLGSAVGHLSAIVDLLKRYTPGDLTLATEILAETQQLANDPATPDDALPIIRGIRDTFFEHVRQATRPAPSQPDVASPVASTAEPPVEAPAVAPAHENTASEPDEPNEAPVEPDAPAPAPAVQHAVAQSVPLDDADVVVSFIQESVDHLDDIEHRVLMLEKEYTPDLVNSIFRSIHTIKGVASFVGFSHVSETSHELETLLDDVRNGKQEVTERVVTVLLDGTDVVANIIRRIEEQLQEAGDIPPAELIEESYGHMAIVSRVREIREGQEEPGSPIDDGPRTGAADAADPPAEPETPTEGRRLDDAPVVTPEMIDAFVEESTDLLDEAEQALLTAEQAPISPESVAQIFRAIHTVKGNAGFFWFSRVESLCMELEGRLDLVRQSGESLSADAAAPYFEMLDAVRVAVRSVATAVETRRSVREDGASGPDSDDEPVNALGEILVEMGEINQESLERALSKQSRRLGEILVTEEHVKPDSVERALAEQAKRRTDAPAKSADYSVNRKDIRVDTSKLDKLFDLVGELITAESMVLTGLGNGHGANGNGESSSERGSVAKAASYLQKITREMQEITLAIRMIPLEATFGKMRRLVRDLSRRFEKQVIIEITGEQTEMDKNVIEEISDPLVHIIRNAIDHGIEPAEDRLAAGKPASGTIKLSAKHEGNEIWISIRDDGRGLNRDRILQKAIERGLLSEADEIPPDEQIYRFILEPAFSTAAQVSEISGRGVGMDVVRQNVEKLRGRIDLQSDPGEGSTVTLRIPLTLAILDGVTFDIAGTNYSVPTTDLVTFQSYDESRIKRTSADHHGFRLRDDVIPIIQYETRAELPEKGVVIVLQANGRQAALVVDQIVGYRQFVVRAMPGYIQGMRAVSGCSIQGDGSISFIIDTTELMEQELERVGSS